jgi:phosphate transport system ATP-binding protein
MSSHNGDTPAPDSTTAAVVEAEGVSCWYGAKQAVRGVSVQVRRGEILAFIGPSGCGKTTFLRSINRLLDLVPKARVEGRVRLDGRDVRDPSLSLEELRRRIGYVFQLPNPFPLSIFDNIALGMLEHGFARSREECAPKVEEVLARVGLLAEVQDRVEDSALRLSGGQQQRLCIGRLLAVGPEVILLDEPCSALDPKSTATIEEELAELKRELAVVIVTHSLAQARRVADRVGFFLDGELVELGPSAELFEQAADPRTRDYLEGRFG